MSKERRLGRGLEALLGRQPGVAEERVEPRPPSLFNGGESTGGEEPTRKASVYEIDSNPFQPRRDFSEADIAELADSLESHGMLQPLVVRKRDERYQLIAGERRLRAAIQAGWSEVPVQIQDVDDRQMAELAIVENLQRKDLNALEKAVSFQQYLQQYACTQEELAGRLKIDRSTVANLIRLLELPADVQDAVRQGAVSQGHARALLPLGNEQEQIEFCRRIQTEGLSVRATEQLVAETIERADAGPLDVDPPGESMRRPLRQRTPQLAALEQEFRNCLGTKVDIRVGARGRGKIVVHFSSQDEFERLHDLLAGQTRTRMAG